MLAAALLPIASAAAEPITIRATPVAMFTDDRRQDRLGALVYQGGLDLRADDDRFGGFSGLWISADGNRLITVSDKGHWLSARLIHDDHGRLTGLADGDLTPILDGDGAPLAGKGAMDAESLDRGDDGTMMVAFEHDHRLARYPIADWPPGAAMPVTAPGLLARAPDNKGIESLATLPDGRRLALTERFTTRSGRVRGWLGTGDAWQAVTYPGDDYFRPTGAAMAGPWLLVLERGFTMMRGVGARLMAVDPAMFGDGGDLPAEAVRELARFEPPVRVDNFEGVAARRQADGGWLIYLLSDDNFNPLQRTLLVAYALDAARLPAAADDQE